MTPDEITEAAALLNERDNVTRMIGSLGLDHWTGWASQDPEKYHWRVTSNVSIEIQTSVDGGYRFQPAAHAIAVTLDEDTTLLIAQVSKKQHEARLVAIEARLDALGVTYA